jgi:alkyl sulfatase BDS1-like metallo-beta-lactamase superfamily hydrolase
MGWFDGNPARLWPHPPAELAKRYLEAIGGIERVVELSQIAFVAADFRWAATLLDHAVFADPDNAPARELYADTLEQLAYGAENGTWRNFFLSGATELREGSFGTPVSTDAPAIVAQLSPEQLFDSLALSIDGPKAWDLDLSIGITLTDVHDDFLLTVRNGVLIYVKEPASGAALHLTLTKPRLIRLAGGDLTSSGVEHSGDEGMLHALLGVLDQKQPDFDIVIP